MFGRQVGFFYPQKTVFVIVISPLYSSYVVDLSFSRAKNIWDFLFYLVWVGFFGSWVFVCWFFMF